MGAVDGCGCEALGPFALMANGCSTSPRARGMSQDTSSTDAEFSSVRAKGRQNFSDRESHYKMLAGE